MKILNGKKIADKIKEELKKEVLDLQKKNVYPSLAVVIVGDDSASKVYVRNKKKACEEIGIKSQVFELPKETKEKELLDLIQRLNGDKGVRGILVQLPLPNHISEEKVIDSISPAKDVDCFKSENIGKMFLNKKGFLPCTPAGILEILKRYEIDLIGKNVTIIGRSNIVGKPLALMMINAGATVTICNSKTKNLKEKTLQADIVVSAVGSSGLITKDMIKQGAVVVDVGMNRNDQGKLVGDVEFQEVSEIASFITPVPGGVGLMTIAWLMKNTVLACSNYCE